MSIYHEAANRAGMKPGPERDTAIATVKAEQHDRLLDMLGDELHEAFMEVRCQEDPELAAIMAAARVRRTSTETPDLEHWRHEATVNSDVAHALACRVAEAEGLQVNSREWTDRSNQLYDEEHSGLVAAHAYFKAELEKAANA